MILPNTGKQQKPHGNPVRSVCQKIKFFDRLVLRGQRQPPLKKGAGHPKPMQYFRDASVGRSARNEWGLAKTPCRNSRVKLSGVAHPPKEECRYAKRRGAFPAGASAAVFMYGKFFRQICFRALQSDCIYDIINVSSQPSAVQDTGVTENYRVTISFFVNCETFPKFSRLYV